MKEIFAKILYAIEERQDLCLVTLVDSAGSAPRKTGSQMLVNESGRVLGTIGGGAVELRSVEMARQLISEKRSELHYFRLHSNSVEDLGMICGGDVTALFQFIDAGDPHWQDLSAKALDQLNAQQGGWFIQRLDGGAPALLTRDLELLSGILSVDEKPKGKSAFLSESCFMQPLPVMERVIIFGAGHIAAALVPLLSTVGFRSWVFDDRAEYVTRERFPQAEKCIIGDFTRIADFITITDEDYAVIMTNGHIHDFEAELQVLRSDFAYIGVIGSRKKTAAVNERLREQGIPDEVIAKVHTPIGTAIKAVTPEEIAVSIAGELILVRAERRG